MSEKGVRPRRPAAVAAGLTAAAAIASTAIFVGVRGEVSHDYWSVSVGFGYGGITSTMSLFAALMLMGVALAAAGRRLVFWIPAVAYSVLPLVTGGPTNCSFGTGERGAGSLVAIAVPSRPNGGLGDCAWSTSATSLQVLLDLALALLPAAVLVASLMIFPGKGEGRSRSRFEFNLSDVCAAILLAGSTTFVWFIAFPDGGIADAAVWMPVFLFGLLLGTRRAAWIWSLVAVPWLWGLWAPGHLGSGEGFKVPAILLAGLLGALTDRLVPCLRWILRKADQLIRAAPDGSPTEARG